MTIYSDFFLVSIKKQIFLLLTAPPPHGHNRSNSQQIGFNIDAFNKVFLHEKKPTSQGEKSCKKTLGTLNLSFELSLRDVEKSLKSKCLTRTYKKKKAHYLNINNLYELFDI